MSREDSGAVGIEVCDPAMLLGRPTDIIALRATTCGAMAPRVWLNC